MFVFVVGTPLLQEAPTPPPPESASVVSKEVPPPAAPAKTKGKGEKPEKGGKAEKVDKGKEKPQPSPEPPPSQEVSGHYWSLVFSSHRLQFQHEFFYFIFYIYDVF